MAEKKTTNRKSAKPAAEATEPKAGAPKGDKGDKSGGEKKMRARARTKKVAVGSAPGNLTIAGGPHARLNFLRIAPRKVRLVANHVRGKRVGDALAMLKFTPQAAAKPLAKLLRSAVANAEQGGGRVDVDALVVRTLTVDGGPKMRRFMPRAMGRAYRVEKKTSHVYVELGTEARG
jgi:large subunit ribosomal protein L22